MSLNFIFLFLIGLSVSQTGHTFSDSVKTIQNQTKKDGNIVSTPVNQGLRDKRLETSKDESVSNKVEDCATGLVNSSFPENGTLNCSNAVHGTSVGLEMDSNMTGDGPKWLNNIKSGAFQRTGFVVLGIMSILVFFFVIRAIRIRQKRSKSRKYGVIASTASAVEMEPLERGGLEDDEEETTLFDAQQKFRNK